MEQLEVGVDNNQIARALGQETFFEWAIRFPFIELIVSKPDAMGVRVLREKCLIEWVRLGITVKWSGGIKRLPDSVYEQWCEIRDQKKTIEQKKARQKELDSLSRLLPNPEKSKVKFVLER